MICKKCGASFSRQTGKGICNNCALWDLIISMQSSIYLERRYNHIYIKSKNKGSVLKLLKAGIDMYGYSLFTSRNSLGEPPLWAIPQLKRHPNTYRVFSKNNIMPSFVYKPKVVKRLNTTAKCHMKGCFDRKWCAKYEPTTPNDDWNVIPKNFERGTEYCPYFIDKFNV